jgi:hypothetical protein
MFSHILAGQVVIIYFTVISFICHIYMTNCDIASFFLINAAASDKVYQLLVHGWCFSPASSTTKTGRHLL